MPLFVVATPIGHLKDITLRALEALRSAEWIVCEDTRRTMKLLTHYKILGKKLTSLNDYNEKRKTPHIIDLLLDDKNVVLVSDNGTPTVCDPGSYLIKGCHEKKIRVIPAPGPSALIAALSCSGMETSPFCFYGFLPKKKGAKLKILESIGESTQTHILYESPYRMGKTLSLLNDILPAKTIFIARELTKVHEEFLRGVISEVYESTKQKKWKGELVLIIH